jgi:hypothetical protein
MVILCILRLKWHPGAGSGWRLMRAWDIFIGFVQGITSLTWRISARAQLLAFVYKTLHVRHPSYIFSLFHFASSARTRNLVVPLHRSNAMSQSFIVRSAVLWNSLPHSVKALPSLGQFISAVKAVFSGRDGP